MHIKVTQHISIKTILFIKFTHKTHFEHQSILLRFLYILMIFKKSKVNLGSNVVNCITT